MKTGKRIIWLLLVFIIIFTLSGCEGLLSSVGDAIDGAVDGALSGGNKDEEPKDDYEAGGEVTFPDGEEEKPDVLPDSTTVLGDAVPVWAALDSSVNLNSYLDGDTSTLNWVSSCPSIASVSSGEVSANKVGRTEISAYSGTDLVGRFIVTVEFMISGTGFDFTTTLMDGETYKVGSLYEANRLLDRAIAEHKHKIKIDFSAISESFKVDEDFDLDSEFGGHTALRMVYYPSTSYLVEFEIIYNREVASYTTPLTEEHTYGSVASGNAIARRAYNLKCGVARADDFEGFAINSVDKEWDVYNSEELWWAVEHGYKPTFPIKHTKAELFYERAKMILRDIIAVGMTDYEKALAIYEYLVEAVTYDYDAYYASTGSEDEKKNTCYYLEGVFEVGRAVCDGKSKAFVLLCGIEGIDCVRAFGSSRSGGVGHAWNYVKLGEYWYLVDTTEGDSRFEDTSNIAKFFGERIETVSYEAFLLPAYNHYEKYTYGEMWENILQEGNNFVYPDDYFEVKLGESSYDFRFNSRAEVSDIFAAIDEAGMPDEFIITFTAFSSMLVQSYFSGIESTYGLTMQLFTIEHGDSTAYLALFKSIE